MGFTTAPIASTELLTVVMNMIAQRTGFSFTLQAVSQYGDTQFYSCGLNKENFGILRFAIVEAQADLQVDSIKTDLTRRCPFQWFEFRISATLDGRLQRNGLVDVSIYYVYRPDLGKVFELADYEQKFPAIH